MVFSRDRECKWNSPHAGENIRAIHVAELTFAMCMTMYTAFTQLSVGSE
jgi:hypothetical protein